MPSREYRQADAPASASRHAAGCRLRPGRSRSRPSVAAVAASPLSCRAAHARAGSPMPTRLRQGGADGRLGETARGGLYWADGRRPANRRASKRAETPNRLRRARRLSARAPPRINRVSMTMFRWFEKQTRSVPAGRAGRAAEDAGRLLPALHARRLALHRRSRRCSTPRSPLPKCGCSASSAASSTGCRCRTARPSLQTEGWKLAGMAFIVLVALPATVFISSLINQQTLMGNYPMRIRWQVHRYLLKQSMTFYQDEFAGRIATKLMQTALAVRECVIKLIDVLNYVIVYFLGMLFIVGSADWRLATPLVGLARLLCRAAALLHPASRQGGGGAGRCALDDDRPRRRQLHQHPDGEAVLACAARGVLRQGGHGELPRHGLPVDAAGHAALRRALRPQLAAARFRSARCRSGCGSARR